MSLHFNFVIGVVLNNISQTDFQAMQWHVLQTAFFLQKIMEQKTKYNLFF